MSCPSHDDLLDPNLVLPSNTSSIYTNFTDPSLHDISPSSEDPAVNPSSSQPSTMSADLSLSTSKSAPHPCKVCGVNAFFLCRACGFDGPRYCSEKCQDEDWSSEHHSKCKAKKKTNTEEDTIDSRERRSSEGKSTGHKGLTRGNIAQIINTKREWFGGIGKDLFLIDLLTVFLEFIQGRETILVTKLRPVSGNRLDLLVADILHYCSISIFNICYEIDSPRELHYQ